MVEYPPGGRNTLVGQYTTIGAALLNFERLAIARAASNEENLRRLRRELSFIPVEVLESYLEDLLNLAVADDSLFIQNERMSFSYTVLRYVPAVGILLALGMGFYSASPQVPPYVSFLISIGIALPFVVLWELTPRRQMRRLKFAQTLSKEINRRRGRYDDGEGCIMTPILGTTPQSAGGA